MSTLRGSARHLDRAIDALGEHIWRATGIRRLTNWLGSTKGTKR